jgi:hypothetical protein
VPSHLLDHKLFDFSKLSSARSDVESELVLAVGHTDVDLAVVNMSRTDIPVCA